MKEEDQALLAQLGEEEALKLVRRALDLSEGFDFYILLVRTPRLARAVVQLLRETREVQHVDPYAGLNLRKPLEERELAGRVQESLLTPHSGVTALDVTRAVPQDQGAWTFLFERMNEQRNTLRRQLGRPLLLLLPPAMERGFAEAAPDFWSVRSGAFPIEAMHDLERVELLGEPLPPPVGSVFGEAFDQQRVGEYGHAQELLEQRILEARMGGSSEHWVEDLIHLGELHWERGDRWNALAAFSEAMVISQDVMSGSEYGLILASDCAVALGDIHRERGYLRRARQLYDQALQDEESVSYVLVRLFMLSDTILELDRYHEQLVSPIKESAFWPWGRTMAQIHGDWALARGDLERALVHYEDMASSDHMPSDSAVYYLTLERLLGAAACRRAYALRKLDRMAEAQAVLDQVLALWQGLFTHPLYPPHVSLWAEAHLHAAALAEAQGNLAAALQHYEHADSHLQSLYPQAVDGTLYLKRMYDCSAALHRLKRQAT